MSAENPDASEPTSTAATAGSDSPTVSPCDILHIDMDAFYASVEVRDNPALTGKAVIVGNGTGRGVVLSATYEARKYGVRSAMPVAAATRLAPHAVVVPPHHERYAQASQSVMAIFHDVTPVVEPLSLDEAFLDVSGAHRLFGTSEQIGQHIRRRVQSELSLTCSVGVATNKFIAKLASDACKPDGMLVVPADRILTFLHPLPIERVWGVGAKTAQALRSLGIATVADLAEVPVATLERVVGKAHGSALAELAWGRDERLVHVDAPDKSIGSETTFEYDRSDIEEIRAELLRQSMRVATRMRAADLVCKTIAIKVKFDDFSTVTRSRSVAEPTDVSRDIYSTASALLDGLHLQRVRVRLVGVRAEGLRPASEQVVESLFEDETDAWSALERAGDAAIAKFGSAAVTRARLIPPGDRGT